MANEGSEESRFPCRHLVEDPEPDRAPVCRQRRPSALDHRNGAHFLPTWPCPGRYSGLRGRRRSQWLESDIPIPPSGMDVTHRLSPLNRRLRMEFLAGAEADSRRRLGRGLTLEELERVLRRYPGDVGADMTRGFRF